MLVSWGVGTVVERGQVSWTSPRLFSLNCTISWHNPKELQLFVGHLDKPKDFHLQLLNKNTAQSLYLFSSIHLFIHSGHLAQIIITFIFNLIYFVVPAGSSSSLWYAGSLVVACGIQFPDQGSKPSSLHWECGGLTTGPLGSPHHCIWNIVYNDVFTDLFPHKLWAFWGQRPSYLPLSPSV